MKITTKQICITGILLAICIVSQIFKNLSVFITGPIVNLALIIAAVYCGMVCGIILGIITPITAFFITGSPIMSAVPLMFPCIMLGNIVLVIAVVIFMDKLKFNNNTNFIISMAIGAIVKGLVMGIVIALIVLPNFLPEPMLPKLPVLQAQFSTVQLATAAIGGVYAYIVKLALDKLGINS